MSAEAPVAPICWVVSDGRRGIESQALGLAEALARLTPLDVRRVGVSSDLAPLKHGDRADECELWIGCGRAALRAARTHRQSNPRATFVYVQDPRRDYSLFDLIVPPQHDGVSGDNVFPILGSPNCITPDRLEDARSEFSGCLAQLPSPRVAVLIGGASKRHTLTDALGRDLLSALAGFTDDGAGLMITTSRRTPASFADALRAQLAQHRNAWLWSGEADGPNPYFAFLAGADLVLCTKDSTNMLTEAASAGKPALLLPMAGRDGKFEALYAALEERGYARPFQGELDTWEVAPLRETERAAAEVLRVMRRRAEARGG